jgi:hypothetical protein
LAAPRDITIPVPYDGLDTDTAENAMPFTRARIHQNWLPGLKGKLPVRGPLKHVVAHHAGAETAKPIAVIPFGDTVLITRRARSATEIVDPWKAPYIAGDPAVADTSVTLVDLEAASAAQDTWTKAEEILGPRYVRVGNFVYAISFDTRGTALDGDLFALGSGLFQKMLPLVRWDGTTTEPYLYRNAPFAPQDVTLHAERLFVLGGLPPNPVFNPSVQSDPESVKPSGVTTGWTAGANTSLGTSTVGGDPYVGTLSFQLSRTGGATGSISMATATANRIAVTPGKTWKAMCRVRADSNSRTVNLIVTFYDAAGAVVTTFTGVNTDAVGSWSGIWEDGEILVGTDVLKVPDGAVTVGITIEFTNVPNGEIHYVDDVRWFSPKEVQWNTLWFTDPIGDAALPDEIESWQDNASGLVNQIVADGTDVDDYGVALARVNGNLVIFKRRSIHQLYGYSAATFNLKSVTREFGCIDPNSVLEYDNGVIFMSQKGLMFFDGSEMTSLSTPITQSPIDASANALGLVNQAVAYNRDTDEPQNTIHVGPLPGDFVMVNHSLVPTDTGNVPQPLWHGYINMRAGAWSRFSSPDVALVPLFVVRTSNHHVMVTDRDVQMLDTFAAPEGDLSSDARYFDEDRVGTLWSIDATFKTKPINIGSPFQRAALNLVALDYFVLRTTDGGPDVVLTLEVDEDQGTVLRTFSTIAASPAFTDAQRDRWVQEVLDEVTTLAIQVTTTFGSHNPAEPISYAEVQQLHVEYQSPTHRRSSD